MSMFKKNKKLKAVKKSRICHLFLCSLITASYIVTLHRTGNLWLIRPKRRTAYCNIILIANQQAVYISLLCHCRTRSLCGFGAAWTKLSTWLLKGFPPLWYDPLSLLLFECLTRAYDWESFIIRLLCSEAAFCEAQLWVFICSPFYFLLLNYFPSNMKSWL